LFGRERNKEKNKIKKEGAIHSFFKTFFCLLLGSLGCCGLLACLGCSGLLGGGCLWRSSLLGRSGLLRLGGSRGGSSRSSSRGRGRGSRSSGSPVQTESDING